MHGQVLLRAESSYVGWVRGVVLHSMSVLDAWQLRVILFCKLRRAALGTLYELHWEFYCEVHCEFNCIVVASAGASSISVAGCTLPASCVVRCSVFAFRC